MTKSDPIIAQELYVTPRDISLCRALVTGASSGIGRALSLELARQGARVVAVARRAERLVELAAQAATLPGKIETVTGDVTVPEDRRRSLDRAREAFDGLDVLVNNAGIGSICDFERADPAVLRQVMEINFFAPVELTREALPMLRQSVRPLIVNVSSILGHRGVPHYTDYCASKFAMQGFSEALRAELAADPPNQRIGVLVVSPGPTQSEFWQSLVEKQDGVGSRGEGAISVEKVARRIVRAMRKDKHEIIPSGRGRLLVWLNRLSPRLADAMVTRFG
jgi:short-subunit dehydrogenase